MGMFRSSDPRNTPKNLEFFVHKEKNFENFGVKTEMPQWQDHKECSHQVSLSYDDGNLEKIGGTLSYEAGAAAAELLLDSKIAIF